MLAHYHAQIWNGTEIAASMGTAPNTARSYLDALEQTSLHLDDLHTAREGL